MEHGRQAAAAAATAFRCAQGRRVMRRLLCPPALCRRIAADRQIAPLAGLICTAVLICHAPGLTVGIVENFDSMCGSPEDNAAVTANYACGEGTHLLPLSLEYGSGGSLCGNQFQGAPPSAQWCTNVTSENATSSCAGEQQCRVELSSWITCNASSWRVNYVKRRYSCVKGDSWHDACARPMPASYSAVPLFIHFGLPSPRPCVCDVSLLWQSNSSTKIDVRREPGATLDRLATSQISTVLLVSTTRINTSTAPATRESEYRPEASDDVTTSTTPGRSTIGGLNDGASETLLDECVTVEIVSTETSQKVTIKYSGSPFCRSQYAMVYSLQTSPLGPAQWTIECATSETGTSATPNDPVSYTTDSSNSRRLNESLSAAPTVVSTKTASDSSTVALAAGLTGGLVGAAIAGTVLATVLMRLRREKVPRRSAGSGVRRPASSRKASRQQSTMVISESDYNSRYQDGEADQYYELPSVYAGNGGVPAAPARPTPPSAAEDYSNGYIEALREDGCGGAGGKPPASGAANGGGTLACAPTAPVPSEKAEPQQAATEAAASLYETPATFAGSLPNSFCYESLKYEPSTQL